MVLSLLAVLATVTSAARAPASAPLAAPVPVTKATQGTLPPSNPPANIPPSPDFFQSCTGSRPDNSSACVNASLAAIDNAREQEGLPAMVLPSNWAQLTPQEQLYVATNLERTVRGLPPLTAMSSVLGQSAAGGAAGGYDPTPPSGFPASEWGSNWGGAIGNPLETVYLWMYDDGPGSSNIDCPQAGASGCWGHRDNVLINLPCQDCVMGTGFDATGWNGYPAWAELLVETSGSPAADFTWSQVTSYLPGAPKGSGMAAPAVGMVSTPDGGGYWLVSSDGGIYSFGDATFYGSMGGHPLSAPVVAMASTPDGRGYWEVSSDGGIFAFGDAAFAGSMGGQYLARPIVGMASTPGGQGYWEVASDGGIFAFGGAPFFGSTGGMALNRPVVGISPTSDGQGYWLTASDGGIFAFGNAPFHGSTGGMHLDAPVVGMAAPSTSGYWLSAADGGIFAFDVPFHGSMA